MKELSQISNEELLASLNEKPAMENNDLKKLSDAELLKSLESTGKEKQTGANFSKEIVEMTSTPLAIAKGMRDITSGVKQRALQLGEKIGLVDEGKAQAYTDAQNKDALFGQIYPAIEKAHPFNTGVGEIIGGTVATAPLAAIGAPVQIAGRVMPMAARAMMGGAAQGAGAGAMMFDTKNDLSNTAVNIAAGSTIGAAIPGVAAGIGKGISAFRRSPIQLAQETADEAKKRLDEFKSLGVENPTAGAITRDPTIQATEELMIKGTDNKAAGEMRTAYENVEKQIYQAAQKMVKTLGGKSKDNVDIGQEVKDVSGNIYRENNKKVSDLYDIAKNAEGADFAINKQPILDAYKQIQSDFIDVKFSPSVRNTMDLLSADNTRLNVNQAIKLTKRLNASAENASNYADKKAIGILKEKVYDQIDALSDLDIPSAKLFNIAKQARKDLGSTFNQRDIVELIRKKKAQYTDYIDPEKVVGRINTLKDWEKIEQALTYKGVKGIDGADEIADPAGIEAYNNLRTTKLNDFFEDSSVDVNGQMQLSLPKLTKNYEKISEPVMRKIIGNDDVFNDFNTLMRVMNYWKNKAPGTINTSNSANAINRIAARGMNTLSSIPVLGEGLFFVKKLFEDAKDAKWVQQNLSIGKGKIEASTKKKRKEPTFLGNLSRLTAPVMATSP